MQCVAPGHGVVAVEAGNEPGQPGRRPRRTDRGRHTGQRHVFAVVQVEANADPGDAFRQTDAVDVDVVDVELVVGTDVAGDQLDRPDGDRLQGQVRQHVGGIAVVDAQGAVEPFRAPLGHQAEVATLVRGESVAIGQAQELVGADRPRRAEERVDAADQREVVAAVLDAVVEAEISAGLRQSRRVPVEEVLRA
ncbi:hypothetical protein D9M71_58390 [compost metagenome]